jgi:protein TonB
MNILGNNSSKLNEVIFENRNKNYGAYAIRSSYNDSLKKSLIYLSSIVFLLFGSVIISNKINGVAVHEIPLTFEDPKIDLLTYTTEVDITPPVIEPHKNNAVAAAPKGTIGTTVTDDVIETTPVNMNNPVSGTGASTATGISNLGTETSTVTTIIIANTTPSISTDPVSIADEMPEFDGGAIGLMRYVGQNISYPEMAKIINKEGIVYVSFVVNELGYVENAKVMRGIGYGCDEEVLRVVSKMPRWKKVGKNGGHPVKVRYNIPVSFRLK